MQPDSRQPAVLGPGERLQTTSRVLSQQELGVVLGAEQAEHGTLQIERVQNSALPRLGRFTVPDGDILSQPKRQPLACGLDTGTRAPDVPAPRRLQLADDGQDRPTAQGVYVRQHLHRALVLELAQPRIEMLLLADVPVAQQGEVLGLEAGDRFEAQLGRSRNFVAQRGAMFGPNIANRLAGFFEPGPSGGGTALPDLTPRERELLEAIAAGSTIRTSQPNFI